MNRIVVYRVDEVTKKEVPVGTVEERRKFERGANLVGLIRVARKTFPVFPRKSLYINLSGGRIAF
ncbi:MAG: hypothetical protein FIA93_04970 [Deltaproteobacteria bacterium]|nr:hypothetical protein [Deltaproteobacteria bacterium]PWB61691.1 MAG: hypothetical protein C3F14_11455 [Deltaproteobacteria bacterium]